MYHLYGTKCQVGNHQVKSYEIEAMFTHHGLTSLKVGDKSLT